MLLIYSWLLVASLARSYRTENTGGTTYGKADHLWQPYLVRGDHLWQQKLPWMVRGDHLWRGTICGVTGHHVYKDIWTGSICAGGVEQEDDNPEDCFAVCIVKYLIQISSIFIVTFLLWCNFASCWATCAYQPWLGHSSPYCKKTQKLRNSFVFHDSPTFFD